MSSETRLIFVGNEFYSRSGTMMSSIYAEDGMRYDWGMVNCDLRDGNTVTIRPATSEELVPYLRRLSEMQAERARREATQP